MLILDKITEHIRKGTLIQYTPAPPQPQLDKANELGKPASESDMKCLALKKTFPDVWEMFMSKMKVV